MYVFMNCMYVCASGSLPSASCEVATDMSSSSIFFTIVSTACIASGLTFNATPFAAEVSPNTLINA